MSELDRLIKQIEATRKKSERRTKNTNDLAEADPLYDVSSNSVTKSHALSRAYYRFSITEKRCMEAMISKLNPLRTDNPQEIELLATEYVKAFPDAGKHAYEHLEKAGDALVNRVITIESPNSNIDREKIPLMSIVRYHEKQGKITCEFNPHIVPHLIGLRNKFSSYPLRKAVNFSSSYTWRFYEILVSWAKPKAKTDGRFMGWIDRQSVDELREMLGVPKGYQWVNFQGQVLDVVEKELREKADIFISFERVKTGRKITHLNIKFATNDQPKLPL